MSIRLGRLKPRTRASTWIGGVKYFKGWLTVKVFRFEMKAIEPFDKRRNELLIKMNAVTLRVMNDTEQVLR